MKMEALGYVRVKSGRLEENVRKAVQKKGVKAEMVKVTEITEIADRSVMIKTRLAIDRKVISPGKVPHLDGGASLL